MRRTSRIPRRIQAAVVASTTSHDEAMRVGDITGDAIASVKAHERKLVQRFMDRDQLADAKLLIVLRRLVLWNRVMMGYAFVLTVISVNAASSPYGGGMTLLISAACSTVLLAASVLGIYGIKFESDRLLLLYFAVVGSMCVALCLSGGLTFFFLPDSGTASSLESLSSGDTLSDSARVSEYWDSQRRGASAADVARGEDVVRANMITTATFSLLFVPVIGVVLRATEQLVLLRRATHVLLLVFNTLLVPVALLVMVGGIYLILGEGTGTTTGNAYTSLFAYVVGAMVLVAGFFGCFGTAIKSRGLLKVFTYLAASFAMALMTGGAVAFLGVQAALGENWEDLRYAMPPTFSGKYDREYFDKFVGQTQYIVGFCCFAGSVVFLLMALAAVFLRAELQALQQAEHDLEEALAQDEATMDHLLRHGHKVKQQWKAYWSDGSDFSRCMVRIVCASCCGLVFFIVIGGVIVMLFNARCEQFDQVFVTTTAGFPLPPNKNDLTLSIQSTFVRGSIYFSPPSSGAAPGGRLANFTQQILAYPTYGQFTDVLPTITAASGLGHGNGNGHGNGHSGAASSVSSASFAKTSALSPAAYHVDYDIAPKNSGDILGTDFACQVARVRVQVPIDMHRLTVNIRALTNIFMQFGTSGPAILFASVKMVLESIGSLRARHVRVRATPTLRASPAQSSNEGEGGAGGGGMEGSSSGEGSSLMTTASEPQQQEEWWGKHGDPIFSVVTGTGDIELDTNIGAWGNSFVCASKGNALRLNQWADVVELRSTLGMINVRGLSASYCDVVLKTRSPIQIGRVVVTGGTVTVEGRSRVNVTALTAGGFRAVTKGWGVVVANVIHTTDVKDGIRATSESGSVQLLDVRSQGSIQVETISGRVEVRIRTVNARLETEKEAEAARSGGRSGEGARRGARCVDSPGFRGIIQILTTGSITITNERSRDHDDWLRIDSSSVVLGNNQTKGSAVDGRQEGVLRRVVTGTSSVTGSVYCHNKGNCGYKGELTISSKTGDVHVVLMAAPVACGAPEQGRRGGAPNSDPNGPALAPGIWPAQVPGPVAKPPPQ